MKKRYLCWDSENIKISDNTQIVMHKPEKKNIALFCNDEWEGTNNGYASIIKCSNCIRMYYRASASMRKVDGTTVSTTPCICVAESYDGGITFHKINVGNIEFNGSKNNNIIFIRGEDLDNFSVFYDENPDCPEDEKFKALSEAKNGKGGYMLVYYASKDGINFEEKYPLSVKGTMDTYNVTFWDKQTKQYFLYYRSFHDEGETDLHAHTEWIDYVNSVRDVRVATSTDFLNWTEHGRIQFKEGQKDYPLYTNQIEKYYRSPDTFIGFPSRYIDRASEKENFKFMPLGDMHEAVTKQYGREGTALTDCTIMTSEDGFTFNRRDEGFITPGIECRDNWWYGNCYTVYGILETKAEKFGAPNEISIYEGEGYRTNSVNFRRSTIRLDGFFSWYAPFAGGEIVTKPIKVSSNEMEINFSTSALGSVIISVCDEDGNALDGYTSYPIFGDSTSRPVEFEKPLSLLNGKNITLKIKLSDAHLYSFVI